MYKQSKTSPYIEKIKIDFDASKKIFYLSILIFSSPSSLPTSIQNYVQAREGHSFEPYKTAYLLEGSSVYLTQELPFHWGFQPSFREQIHGFKKIAAQCSHLLLELAIEEKLSLAEPLYHTS